MVDSFDTTQAGSVALDGEAPPKTGLAGFMATTAGKLVVGGIAVVLLLVALGVIFFLYVLNVPEPEPGIIVPGATESTGSVEATIEVRPAPSVQDTFAFRNIFEPTAKPRGATSASSTDGSTDGSTDSSTTAGGLDVSSVPRDTLFFANVLGYSDGESKALFVWNGKEYEVAEGEVLEGTPWKFVRLEGNTAVMLYGDATVRISIGQGISK